MASTEFPPAETKFAYAGRHSVLELPDATLSALRPTEDVPAPQTPAVDNDDNDIDSPKVTARVVQAQKATRVLSRNELCHAAASVAEANNLPIPFFTNLIQQESGFKPHVVSPAGAQGIAQFMPRVAAAYGLHNPFDPIHALVVSGKFLRELLGQFGNNLGLAAAAYNGGSGRVGNWLAKKGRLPDETRTYVRNITGQPVEHWVRAKGKAEEVKLPRHARCPSLQTIEARVIVPAQSGYDVAAATPPAPRHALASAGSKPVIIASKGGRKTIIIGGPPSKKPIALAAAPAPAPLKVASAPTKMASALTKKSPGAVAAAPRGKVNTTIMAAEKAPAHKQANVKLASVKPIAKVDAKPAAKADTKTAAKADAKTASKTAAKPAAVPAAANKKIKVATR